jgi:branched-chain amino acid transport system substrate-binding protein
VGSIVCIHAIGGIEELEEERMGRIRERRRGSWALVLVLALVMAACSGGDEEADEPATTTTAAPTTTAGDTGETTATTEAPSSEPSGDPIVIGSTLSLTGGLAPTAAIHKVAGDLFVERLNANGGLLGRPVEWLVLDDESTPDRAAALYERLITEDGVDLIVGPYGTGNITAAMQVAERYGYVFPQHTGSLTYAFSYECQFPAWPTGRNPNITNPNLVYDALESSDVAVDSVAFVVSQFPGTMFIAYGQPDTDEGGAVKLAEERGYEVVLDINYPLGTTDWAPIAAQVRDADPDFLFMGAIGVDGPNLIAAMDAIGYRPPNMFFQWPAPGPLLGANADGALSVTAFEPHSPFTDDPDDAAIAEAFSAAATAAGLPYPAFETQASASWAAWQILVAGVEGVGSLDNGEVCNYLVNNQIETVFGPVDFGTESNNYYGDISYVKQIQDGDWFVVYPTDKAAPGRSIVVNPGE